jgi:GNAT superfamily N-acetyltransferase
MEIAIRRIRGDEGPALEACRLAALKESPSAFGSTYAAEANRPEEWTARAQAGAAGVDRVTFFALMGDEVVGLAGGFRPETEQFVVELVSMWAAPDARRAGLGRGLVGAVVGWAREVSATTVRLWVTRGNAPAHSLYESLGFRETGETQPLPSDLSLVEVCMTLDLRI